MLRLVSLVHQLSINLQESTAAEAMLQIPTRRPHAVCYAVYMPLIPVDMVRLGPCQCRRPCQNRHDTLMPAPCNWETGSIRPQLPPSQPQARSYSQTPHIVIFPFSHTPIFSRVYSGRPNSPPAS